MNLKALQEKYQQDLAKAEQARDVCLKNMKPIPETIVATIEDCTELLRQCRDAANGKFWTLDGLFGLGEMMIAKRQTLGLSQKAVADKLGIHHITYHLWEKGEFMKQSLEDIIKILEILGMKLVVDTRERFNGDDIEEP